MNFLGLCLILLVISAGSACRDFKSGPSSAGFDDPKIANGPDEPEYLNGHNGPRHECDQCSGRD